MRFYKPNTESKNSCYFTDNENGFSIKLVPSFYTLFPKNMEGWNILQSNLLVSGEFTDLSIPWRSCAVTALLIGGSPSIQFTLIVDCLVCCHGDIQLLMVGADSAHPPASELHSGETWHFFQNQVKYCCCLIVKLLQMTLKEVLCSASVN